MNAQTPGPLITDTSHKADREGVTLWMDDVIIADVVPDQHGQHKPNAALLAASYSAFDRAGRELGIDAATLAASLDLAALIRAAREAVTEPSPDTPALIALARLLADLPTY